MSRLSEVLFLRKSRFSDQINSVWDGFLIDFGWFWEPFGLASKSHQKIDGKIDQILDGFWKDFGSQMGSKLGPFWLQKSIKNQGRFLKEKGDGWQKGPAAEAGLGRVLFFAQRLILDKEVD